MALGARSSCDRGSCSTPQPSRDHISAMRTRTAGGRLPPSALAAGLPRRVAVVTSSETDDGALSLLYLFFYLSFTYFYKIISHFSLTVSDTCTRNIFYNTYLSHYRKHVLYRVSRALPIAKYLSAALGEQRHSATASFTEY